MLVQKRRVPSFDLGFVFVLEPFPEPRPRLGPTFSIARHALRFPSLHSAAPAFCLTLLLGFFSLFVQSWHSVEAESGQKPVGCQLTRRQDKQDRPLRSTILRHPGINEGQVKGSRAEKDQHSTGDAWSQVVRMNDLREEMKVS